MNFQFYCPQGHLLQADTAHAGSVIVCPVCGTQFIIPSPPPQAASVASPVVSPVSPVPPVSQESGGLDFASASSKKRSSGKPDLNQLLGGADAPPRNFAPDSKENPVAEEEPVAEASPFAMMNDRKAKETTAASIASMKETLSNATAKPKKAEELDVLRIPCPKGHVLDVDREMLGQRVQCPVCRAVYDLKLENSLEYIREKKAAEELEEARLGKVWIVRAVIAGVLLIIFLIILIFT